MLQHLQYVPTYSEEDAFNNHNAFLTTKRISPLVLCLKLNSDLESWLKVSRFPESPWLFCASIDMTVLQALGGKNGLSLQICHVFCKLEFKGRGFLATGKYERGDMVMVRWKMTRIVLGIQLYNLYCKIGTTNIQLFIIIRYSVTSLLDSLYFAATSEQVEDLILRCTPPPSSLATQDLGEQFVSHKIQANW